MTDELGSEGTAELPPKRKSGAFRRRSKRLGRRLLSKPAVHAAAGWLVYAAFWACFAVVAPFIKASN